MTKEIPLTQGKVALVDNRDYAKLSKFKWSAWCTAGRWYAYRKIGGVTVYMHRVILGLIPGDGKQVDHRNGNGLDNTRKNIRVSTHAENMHNVKAYSKSGYKGVRISRNGRKWEARIYTKGKQIQIGSFDTAEEAARAYDDVARRYFGEYAWLNFPD